MAEEALLDLWTKNEYVPGHAPITIYKCEDCREFHLTSRGPMNERLCEAIKSGKIKLQREANRWVNRLKKK